LLKIKIIVKNNLSDTVTTVAGTLHRINATKFSTARNNRHDITAQIRLKYSCPIHDDSIRARKLIFNSIQYSAYDVVMQSMHNNYYTVFQKKHPLILLAIS